MGTNSIASFLTNYNPTVIIYQQTKQVSSMTPAILDSVFGLFATYATNSDIVLVQSQCDADPAVNADPANGNIYQMQILRPWAVQHHYLYLDDYSYLNDRSNIVQNGMSADHIHLNGTGQTYSGLLTCQQMGLPNLLLSSGLLTLGAFPSPQYPTNSSPQAPTFSYTSSITYGDFTTNAAFTFSAPVNVSTTNYQTAVIFVTNSSGTLFNITPPSGVHAQGTANVTNVTSATFYNNPGKWTNVIFYPLW